jgi:hypothetical protein
LPREIITSTNKRYNRDVYDLTTTTGNFIANGFIVHNCDDGWFQLIYDLSKKLEAEILKQPEEARQHYCASQVKEKYAGLRFYMNCSTDEMQKFIEEAEEKSEKTCEVCGAPGKVREHHMWYYCSCEDHEKGGLNERKW